MPTDSERIMKGVAQRVNQTLKYYESNYVSCQRTPELEKERCLTFEEFIERRFNYEAYKVPELTYGEQLTDGQLFTVYLEEPNDAKHRYKKAYLKLIEPPEECDETLKNEITEIKKFLGGSMIVFNCVKQKIRLKINEE